MMPKLAMLLASLLSPFAGTSANEPDSRWFDLPAQPLERALQAYGQMTGLAVLVDARMLVDLDSREVRGRFRDDEALRWMLAGTGLAPRFVGDDAFTLVVASEEEALPAPVVAPARHDAVADAASRRRSARALQRGLEDALCADPLTRPGGYQATISFRLDGQGRIQQPELRESSGEAARDGAILARVTGLPLPGLPDDLPQPITLTLLPRTSTSTPPCQGNGG